MFYSIDNFIAPDFFQSWCASIRDQGAMQLIAGSAMQQQVRHSVEDVVETGVALLEMEMEVPFVAAAQAARAAPAARKRSRRPAAKPVHH